MKLEKIMDFDSEWLKVFIEKKAKEKWDDDNKPYYMNSIPVDTEKEGVNYKDVIHPYRLRQWVELNEIPNTVTTFDEIHKAKVTFIPEGKHEKNKTQEFDLIHKVEIEIDENFYGNDKLGILYDQTPPHEQPEIKNKRHQNPGNVHISKKTPMSRERLATLRFLEVLSTLSDDEIEKIHIPLKTIVRLLAK